MPLTNFQLKAVRENMIDLETKRVWEVRAPRASS
jgi:hypothetical protein